jgi:circadian clock protein KaiB
MIPKRHVMKRRHTPRRSLEHPASEHKGGNGQAAPTYVLRLYVTGATANSTRALMNIKTICEEHLHGRYELEVIDVYQQPVLARTEQILAAPTLIKHLPLPLRRFIGDMSRTEKILLGLDLQPAPAHRNEHENHGSTPAKSRF